MNAIKEKQKNTMNFSYNTNVQCRCNRLARWTNYSCDKLNCKWHCNITLVIEENNLISYTPQINVR